MKRTVTPNVEKRALIGDIGGIIRVVSALRQYREAADTLLESRYRDGECDAVQLHNFAEAVARAEDCVGPIDGADDNPYNRGTP